MKLALGVVLAILAAQPAFADTFGTFPGEAETMEAALDCDGRLTQTPGMPDLWGCIHSGAEVVKFFINENEAGTVANVKLMWNDWTKNGGYGLHADQDVAEAWLKVLADRYAPDREAELRTVFSGDTDGTITNDGFVLAYTFFKGPGISERLVTVTAAE